MAKYELLSDVDFGMHWDREMDAPKDKPEGELQGVHPAGSELDIPDEHAQPLLEAGSIKPAGEEHSHVARMGPSGQPMLDHDNPEELGYAGEELRDEALKNDEVYQGEKSSSKSEGSKSKASSKNKE